MLICGCLYDYLVIDLWLFTLGLTVELLVLDLITLIYIGCMIVVIWLVGWYCVNIVVVSDVV